jgi:hypothetical protein
MHYRHGLAGSANPNIIFVIAPREETTPFLLEIDSAQRSSEQEIPSRPMTQLIRKPGIRLLRDYRLPLGALEHHSHIVEVGEF